MNRLKALWHVLRGRPLIYRMEFIAPVNIPGRVYNLQVIETAFLGVDITKLRFGEPEAEDAQAVQDEA